MSNGTLVGIIDPEYEEPKSNPTFPQILEQWLASEPGLEHFKLKRFSYLWIMCQCKESCMYRVMRDGVKIYKIIGADIHTTWSICDPDFFDKLKRELMESCGKTK